MPSGTAGKRKLLGKSVRVRGKGLCRTPPPYGCQRDELPTTALVMLRGLLCL